jgi:prepilin-type N-terminal cleavage/methylation domain-containing protein
VEREKGFTLIEVLIAIFILGLGIVTLTNLFPLGLQSLSYARKLNEVYFLAEKKLEELKLQPSITPGETSGEEKDLNWKISIQPLKFPEGIEVTYVELEINFVFQGRTERQRFVSYLSGNQ